MLFLHGNPDFNVRCIRQPAVQDFQRFAGGFPRGTHDKDIPEFSLILRITSGQRFQHRLRRNRYTGLLAFGQVRVAANFFRRESISPIFGWWVKASRQSASASENQLLPACSSRLLGLATGKHRTILPTQADEPQQANKASFSWPGGS